MRANGLDNSGRRREVAATSFEIGNVLQLQGKPPDALKPYSASLAIMSELAKGEPGRDDWQRDLAVTHSAVADVLKTQGKLRDALKSYQASVAILERLAKVNSEWQRDLSVTYVRLADTYRTSGPAGEGSPGLCVRPGNHGATGRAISPAGQAEAGIRLVRRAKERAAKVSALRCHCPA
jgi:hypothetical protein